MLASINPLGERARGSRWGSTFTAYVIASVSGGAVAGAAAAWLGGRVQALVHPGGLPAGTAAILCVAVLVLAGLSDMAGRKRLWWSPRRQVNDEWLVRYRGWVYGAGFGFQLGLGQVTIVTSASLHALFIFELLSGRWLLGALMGAAFGLARALPLLKLARTRSPEGLRRFHKAFDAIDRRARIGAACLLLGLAGALLAMGGGIVPGPVL